VSKRWRKKWIFSNKKVFKLKLFQALKRRSSVLDNDIGSGGPLRRTRQKANLLTQRDKRELGYTALQQLDHASQKLLLMNESEPKSLRELKRHKHALLIYQFLLSRFEGHYRAEFKTGGRATATTLHYNFVNLHLKTLYPASIKEKGADYASMSDRPMIGGFQLDLHPKEMGKVRLRFAPEPSGYLHMGHLKAALLNQDSAQKYHGKQIIRFDDTNPAKKNNEFVYNILNDLKTMGTHALRSSEYHDKNDLYLWIQETMGLRKVHIYEFSRLNIVYTPLSKQKLLWFVENEMVDGWDDAHFPTVQGMGPSKNCLLRNGINCGGSINKEKYCPVVLTHMQLLKKLGDNEKLIDDVNPNSKKEITAVMDENMRKLKHGEILQLERKGYFRCDVLFSPSKPIVLYAILDGRQK
ncbi:glutamate--tRNA ligase, cytoplasmic, partial [Tanacetum coccineum]